MKLVVSLSASRISKVNVAPGSVQGTTNALFFFQTGLRVFLIASVLNDGEFGTLDCGP